MHWEWIVPVIALALWILSSLVKGAEEPAKQARPGDPLPEGSPPRPQSEVDKFLEEINRMRRRQEEEQRQQQEQPRRSEPIPPPAPPPSPAVVQAEQTTAPNFENPAPPAPVPPAEKRRSRPAKPRRSEPPPTQVRQAGSVAEADLASQPKPVLRPPVSKSSPAVAQLHAMLRSPLSVQAAILLQEVLGPPRCRRRRR